MFCAFTVTCPHQPICFRQLVYKVLSYLKREADAIFIHLLLSASPAFVRVGYFVKAEDGGNTSLGNVGTHTQMRKALQPKGPTSTYRVTSVHK
jgi:hypothetical protein